MWQAERVASGGWIQHCVPPASCRQAPDRGGQVARLPDAGSVGADLGAYCVHHLQCEADS